ncbi:MAG: hypothetical protein ACRC7O_02055 [Fimbriiglobus sp.]
MTFEDVLAAARGLTHADRWRLTRTVEAELAETDPPAGTNGEPGTGSYLIRPCARTAWHWEASADLMAEMQRLLAEAGRPEGS